MPLPKRRNRATDPSKAPDESPGLFLYTKETCGSVSAFVAPHVGRDYRSMLSLPISEIALCPLAYYCSRPFPLEKCSDRRKAKCLMFSASREEDEEECNEEDKENPEFE